MDQNTHQVRISVIIPVYNCEKYVGEAVASVLDQPYRNIDIILVDDGSRDSSPALCDRLAAAHDRVRVIHQENAGVSAARNAGIEAVLAGISGDLRENHYVAFLDADDVWYPGILDSSTVDILKNGFQLVGFQTCRANHDLSRRNRPDPMAEGLHKGGTKAVWLNSRQTFGSALYSVSLLRQYSLRFPHGLKINEDLIFSMQFKYLADTVYLINRILYCYRKHPDSVSHRILPSTEKYPPIIAAYLTSDSRMLSQRTPERGHLQEGRAMAAVYIVDMHEEHYQQFRPRRELEQMMGEHPEYLELITSDFAFNRPDSGLRWQQMQAHPVKFRLRCYGKGFVSTVARRVYSVLYRFSGIARIIDRKRYPVPLNTQQTKG